jgi:hypothetical protein
MYTRRESVAARSEEFYERAYSLIISLFISSNIASKFQFTLSVVILSRKVLCCISVNHSALNFHFLRMNVTVLGKFNAFTNSTGCFFLVLKKFQRDDTLYNTLLFPVSRSTCFGRNPRPSSGAQLN